MGIFLYCFFYKVRLFCSAAFLLVELAKVHNTIAMFCLRTEEPYIVVIVCLLLSCFILQNFSMCILFSYSNDWMPLSRDGLIIGRYFGSMSLSLEKA